MQVSNISNSSNTTIYVFLGAGSSGTLESIVIGITMCNKSSVNYGITASVFLDNEDGTNDVFIVKDVNYAGSSLEIMSGNKLVLMNDGSNADNLEAIASAASDLDVTVSVLEDV